MDTMNQDQIDGVLKALTTAEAPAGLEERVLRRVAERRAGGRVERRWFVPVAAVAAVTVLAAVVGVRHRVAPVSAVAPLVKDVGVMETVPHVETHVAEARHGAPGVVRVRAVKATHVEAASFPAPMAPLTEQEKLLVRLARAREVAMTTPPAVAPPRPIVTEHAPLTGEERLLLAVSRVPQPEVLDALDPVRRAAADAADDKEFKAFVASVRHGGTL